MRTSLFTSAALLVLGLVGASASANILTDPGFESNPIGPALGTALSNFPLYQNQWAPESGAIVGTVGGISPNSGSLQMQVNVGSSIGTTSQVGQIVDVSSYATSIDANLATVQAGAELNSDAPAAIGGVYISYYDASYNAIGGNPSNVITLTPSTWQAAGFGPTAVPAGTRWVLFQAAYDINSITSSGGRVINGGFVDDAFVEIKATPEPTSLALVGAAAAGLLLRRRSRA